MWTDFQTPFLGTPLVPLKRRQEDKKADEKAEKEAEKEDDDKKAAKKEKKSDKFCNVEVKQLLPQCTLSHLKTKNDDADDDVVADDGVDGVGHQLGGYLLLFPQSLQHSLRTFV